MSMRILSAALLLLSLCLCFQLSAASRRHPSKGIIPLCCTKVSFVDISADIMGPYTYQHAKEPCVSALIFPTSLGKVCVHPKAGWVQKLKYPKHH